VNHFEKAKIVNVKERMKRKKKKKKRMKTSSDQR
jgi:hypothetical protein